LPFPGKFYFFLQRNFLASGSTAWNDRGDDAIVEASPFSHPPATALPLSNINDWSLIGVHVKYGSILFHFAK
jgi:hypothetical protein